MLNLNIGIGLQKNQEEDYFLRNFSHGPAREKEAKDFGET